MSQLRAEDLSERQRQILDGLVDGKSNGILAEQLGITVDGVKWHVSQMLWDTGCTDRYQLADWWERERGPRRRGAFFGLPGRPSRDALAGPMRLAGTLAVTAVLVVAIYAGWTCSSRTAPATVTPASALGKIAYVQDGDLYVKQLPEGTPQRITHITQADRDANAGFSAPTWSHSGDWLSARRGKEFAVLRADGNNPRFYDAPPVWSPVDDRVAVIEGTTIFVEDADGTNRIPVAQPARVESPPVYVDVTYSDLTWSTDGAQLAYVEHHIRAGLSGFSIPRTYEGIRAVATGGRPTSSEELYNTGSPPTDGLGIFMWAPQTLVFFRYPSFSADIAADGVALEALKPGMATPFQPHYFGSPDPVALLDPSLVSSTPGNVHTAITRGAGRETWTSKRIALLVWQTGVTVDVTETSVAAISPAISQDGQRIAYSAMPDTPGLSGGDAAKTALVQRKIWVMSAASATDAQYSAKQQLTSNPAYRDEYPQWSADGTQILFVRMDAQDHASLWLMDADGSNQHEVLDGFDVPAFPAPDARWFGYYGTISWENSFAWYRPPVAPASSTTPAASATATPDTSALTNTLTLPALGLQLRYPTDWVDHAQQPFAPDVAPNPNVIALGPPSAVHPYGVEVFTMDVNYDDLGCCYVGNDAIGLGGDTCVGCGPGSSRLLRVAGADAQQVEFQRQVPLGIAGDTGDYTPNREIWTAVRHGDDTLFITAFYREGDTAAEQETRAAYNAILASVTVTAAN